MKTKCLEHLLAGTQVARQHFVVGSKADHTSVAVAELESGPNRANRSGRSCEFELKFPKITCRVETRN